MTDEITSQQLVMDTLNGISHDRIPIWFMRQAGRYLPEYMEIRKNSTFEKRSQTPELAAEITTQPIERYNLDIAVIFSDILIPIYSMERGLEIVPGKGPIISEPITQAEDVTSLHRPKADQDYPYLAESIELVRERIPNKAIVGFSGAPFTLASYLLEGKSTKTGVITKGFAFNNPDEFDELMSLLTEVIIDQLHSQIKAGADFVQVFDSWAGHLSPRQFREWSLPYHTKIANAIDVPTIFFSRGTHHILPEAVNTPYDGFSVDTTVTLSEAHDLVGPNKVLQGNLDPAYLLSNPKLVTSETTKILDEATSLRDSRYIFNLGVGINKNSYLNNVSAMVKTVRNYRRSDNE